MDVDDAVVRRGGLPWRLTRGCCAARDAATRSGLVAGPGVHVRDGCVAPCGEPVHGTRSPGDAGSHLDPVPATSALTCSFRGRSAADPNGSWRVLASGSATAARFPASR